MSRRWATSTWLSPRRFRISCSRRPNALSSGMGTTFGAAATFFFMAAVYGGTWNHY